MSHKYYYKSTPINSNKIFQPNPVLDCPTCIITPNKNMFMVYSFNNNVNKKIIKDAPLTFYKTNGGGGGGGGGTTQPNKYQIFINNVNLKIFNNQIDSSNINTYITSVQNMINTLISEDKSYLTNPYYIAMMLLLRNLDYEYTISVLKEDIQNLSIQLNTLTIELNEYKTCCTCAGRKMYVEGEIHGIVANASIAMEYIKYIELYGVPDDGIFLPSLLNEIKTTYNF
jgi:hypothetical protein